MFERKMDNFVPQLIEEEVYSTLFSHFKNMRK